MFTKLLLAYFILDVVASIVIYVAIVKRSPWMTKILIRLV